MRLELWLSLDKVPAQFFPTRDASQSRSNLLAISSTLDSLGKNDRESRSIISENDSLF
ncbi:hypothetical protein LIPSTDRAFT_175950 [Lipomyces starkeyi NRRL Y-11557]|uniref:Uncharacterized protein n=1 Tax=Lipomyces starkeyi NRRL Y-11557 TaxID=675824 RepID=A0A1E3PXY8_LIPST|nr:hypothetical protein LIPSTDRAFT_175950 [Lipomyces starkeyi NRRL Y-11557]